MAKSVKKNIEDILALTPMQEGMLYHYMKEPAENLYFEQLCLDISGAIDIDRFENAWNFVIQTNEMLRTVLRWEGLENPIQMVLKEHHLHPKYHDFSSYDKEEKKKRMETLKADDMKIPFDLTDVPFRLYLCKTGPASYEMLVSYHHILYDGWSNGIILEEFLGAYHALCAGKELKIPAKTKFKEFVTWLQHAGRDKQNAYWSNYLYEFDTPTTLPIKKRNTGERITAANFQTHFDRSTKDKIDAFVKAQRITLASLFYCSWGIVLQRYNNSDDVVFGTTVSGRPTEVPGIERMVGLFINTIPLRIQAFPGENAADLLLRVNEALKEREAYENTPLVEINSGEERFDSIVVIENYPMDSRWNQGKNQLIINSYSMFESTHYDLTLGIELFDDIEINFSYREQAFEKEDIERLAGHFLRIMQDIISNPGKELSQVEMLSGEEKHRLLYEWNNTEKPYPRDKTIHHLFEEQASKTPDHISLVGAAGWAGLRTCPYLLSLSYRVLNQQSDHLAGLLIQKGVLPDNIVGIMMERSVEMIIGILGILKSGGAYLPIDPEYPQERIDYMFKDSNAKILINKSEARSTKFETNPNVQIINDQNKNLKDLMVLSFDHLNFEFVSDFDIRISDFNSSNLAYIIYTSGSTGRPKGVVVEHRAAVNTLVCRKEEYRMSFQHSSLQLFSYAFDGFITSFFTPVLSGARVVLLDESGVKDVQQIKAALVRHQVTHFICVPPLFQAIIEQLTQKEAASLQVVTLAGDTLSPVLLEITKQKSPDLEIVNEYGISEAAVMSSIYRHQEKSGRIAIGRPIWNTYIYIVDHRSRPQPVGVPGELCIAGSGLARGYLNNPGLTAERFKKYRSYRIDRTNIFYKTGDLARWLTDGNIEFLGRIDYQIKIRGFRIELDEITNRLLNHKNIKEAVLLTKDFQIGDNKDKYICAYVIGSPSLKESELRTFLAKDLPGYMIPAYFVFLDKIPLTPTGKVDRKALPEPELTATGNYAPPRTELELRLAKIWSEVLFSQKPGELIEIGIDDNFFKLGGHSIKAAKLVLKIHKQMNIKVPVNVLFENPTIRGLAGYIKKAEKEQYAAIPPAEEREYYPLTAGQKQFYITRHAGHDGAVYNVQNLVQLEGKLSPNARERLENVFKELIHRHESLRTSFEIIGDQPVQRIHKEVEFKLGVRDQGPGNIKSFVRPFDLSIAPLLRVGLIKTGEETHILITDMHHIIADDLSMGLLVKEFIGLYRGEELTPPQLQYRDFALWQTGLSQNPAAQAALKRQETYWLNELNGDIPLLNLPLDFPRPLIRQYKGDSVLFEIDRETAGTLKKLAAAEGVTLYILMLTMFTVLLSRLCDQEDILVGTPIAGRQHPDLETIIGFFATMLVIRSLPGSQKTFREFLREIKDKTLAAYENQDYTYEELVDKLSIRNPDRNALFDVVFVWEDLEIDLGDLIFPGSEREEERLKLKLFNYEKISAPFDLILTGAENQEKMSFFLNYSVALFKRETIERIAADFIAVISGVLENPDIKLGEIEVAHDLLEATPQALMEESGDFGF